MVARVIARIRRGRNRIGYAHARMASLKDAVMKGAVRGILGSQRLTRLVGRKRAGGADAALDPQIAAIVELERIARIPRLDTMEPARARRFAEEGLSPLDPDAETMAQVTDVTVATNIPVRIYTPPDARPHWIIYFHGGGGVIGSIRASDPATRLIAAETRCTVASVEYRLGPEHKHPAACEDALAAYTALLARIPPGAKVATAGDSFGGFLATEVDHRARAAGVDPGTPASAGALRIRPPDLQVLIYPIIDFTLTSPGIDRLANGYLLTRDLIYWFRSHYFPAGADYRAASPQSWPSLRDTAPAIVVTAGYDPLADEGDAHADRLRADGVTVRHRRHDGLVHGFLSMAGAVTAARRAVDDLCREIVEMLG
jgi:acetyl esterase